MASLSFLITAVDQASSVFQGVSGSIGQTQSASEKFSAAFKVASAAAATAAVAFAATAIDKASDLNETLSKSNTIFGSNAAAIEQWANGAAQKMGLSKAAALDAAAGFGDMLSQIGFTGDEAASMSKDVVQMSADLGSFNNLPTEDVAQRISAAFRGEYDSLQALIPNINAARVEQEAMAATGKTNASELTAQEKAAAVLAIVHKDGERAAGDFAKTSDGLANQQKILKAELDNVTASIGTQLLPVAVELIGVLGQVLSFVARNQQMIIPLVAVLGTLAAVIYAITAAARIYTAVQAALNVVMAANPAVLITLAIVALIAVIVLAWQHSETFRAVVTESFGAVLGAIQAAWHWVADNWPLLLAILTGPVGLAVLGIMRYGDEIVSFFTGMPGRIGSALSGAFDALRDNFYEVVNAIIRAWNRLSFSIGGGKYDPLGIYGPDITVPKFTFDTPDIPLLALAQGGLALGPTVAKIGDNRSGRELVLPEEKWAQYGITKGNGDSGSGLTINVNGPIYADRIQMAMVMRDAYEEAVRLGFIPPGALGAAA